MAILASKAGIRSIMSIAINFAVRRGGAVGIEQMTDCMHVDIKEGGGLLAVRRDGRHEMRWITSYV
jgi:hypothetical protein